MFPRSYDRGNTFCFGKSKKPKFLCLLGFLAQWLNTIVMYPTNNEIIPNSIVVNPQNTILPAVAPPVSSASASPPSGVYNPYSQVDPTSQLSGWNRFTDWLGITNHSGQLSYQHNLNSNMWQSQYNSLIEDRDYNNEINTAERMRQAGLNPDIQGVNAGQSELSSNSAASPMQSPNKDVSSFTNTLAQLFNTVMSVASGVSDLNLSLFNNDMSQMNDFVSRYKDLYFGKAVDVVSSLADSERSNLISDILKGNGATLHNLFPEKGDLDFIKPKFRTKRASRIYEQYINSFLMSNRRNELIKRLGIAEDDVFSYAEKVGKTESYTSQSQDRNLIDVTSALADAQYKIIKMQNDVTYKSYKQENSYLNHLDKYAKKSGYSDHGQLRAHLTNVSSRSDLSDINFKLNLKSVEHELINSLAKLAKQGNIFASAAVLGWSTISQRNISLSSSNTSTATKFGTNTSSSWKFGF